MIKKIVAQPQPLFYPIYDQPKVMESNLTQKSLHCLNIEIGNDENVDNGGTQEIPSPSNKNTITQYSP